MPLWNTRKLSDNISSISVANKNYEHVYVVLEHTFITLSYNIDEISGEKLSTDITLKGTF
jgi:hypothetical protein